MTKRWEDNFDALLDWLDSDREQAGMKYEDIRHSLINIFSWQGCCDAEDLADETITRVTNKVRELAPAYRGDPALYFYGVARKMHWEVIRREQSAVTSPALENVKHTESPVEPDDFEQQYDCLDECLKELPASDRELILLYYQQEGSKIDSRRELALALGIAPNNLRVRVHRIRVVLHRCIEKCVRKEDSHETK